MKVTEAGQRFQISDSTGIGLRVEQQWRRKSAVARKEELIAMSGALEATGGWASFEPPLPFGFEWKTLRRALLGWRHGQGEKEGGGREARTQRSRPSAGATQRMEANIAPTSGCGARRRRKLFQKGRRWKTQARDHRSTTNEDQAQGVGLQRSGSIGIAALWRSWRKNNYKTTGRRFEGRGGGVEACGITTEPLRTTIERNNPQQEEREKRNHPGQTKSWKQGV